MTHVPLLGSNFSAWQRIRLDCRSKDGEELSTGRGPWKSLLSGVCGPGLTKAELLVEKLGSRSRKGTSNGPCRVANRPGMPETVPELTSELTFFL